MHYLEVICQLLKSHPVLNQNLAQFACITFSSSVAKKHYLMKAIFVFSFFKQKDPFYLKNHIHLHSRVITSRKRAKTSPKNKLIKY